MVTLGSKIKEVRKSYGITMKDLAQAVQIDQALISKYENDKRYPSEDHMLVIAQYFEENGKSLMTQWISEKIYNVMKKYPAYAEEALNVAEERIAYLSKAQAMEAPRLTKALGDKIEIVDQLQAQWQSLKPLDGIALQKMKEHFSIAYTHESNKIEGNTLTLQDTFLVISEGLTISGKTMTEHLEAINHSDAIGFIDDIVGRKEELLSRTVNEVHSLVLRGIDPANAGRYRTVPVMISGSTHRPPEPYLLSKHMEDYFQFYDRNKEAMHPVILAAEMHERLVTIHPYIDGNGRTSRLIMNLILLRNGYTIANLKGDNASRMKYYRALNEVQTNHDSTDFYHLILDAAIESLQEHIRLVGI